MDSEDAVMKMRYRHLEDVVVEDAVPDQLRQQREAPFRYGHLSEDDKETVEKLMEGRLQEIPRIKSKVIKVFISSTFTDMIEERNALAENVYPKLRDYCRDKYGVDFQAVDMRWGISSQASKDHSVTDLCMAELEHCQNLSIGPNFAMLIGQKYGFCPAPPGIERSVFEAIRCNLENNSVCVKLLDKCYKRDQNVAPSVYRLLDQDTCSEVTGKPWEEVEIDIKECILRGGQLAVQNSDITQDTLRHLTCSVTEAEIHGGLLGVLKGKDRENNCVALFRDIDDLFDNLECEKAKRYCDMIPNSTEVNGEAKVALNKMRENVKDSLSKFNYSVLKVQWTDKGIDPAVHKDYLNTVCNHFYHTIKGLADKNMVEYSSLIGDPLYTEFKTYLTGDTHQALVVHGESGVGKTSFMAKAASSVRGMWAMHNQAKIGMKTFVIPRFIGITPKSSNVQQLLFSVCHQLAFVTGGYRHEIPEDYKSLKMYFIDRVQKGDFPGMVVIFLDSLDQLSSTNNGDKLDWLPARLAPNVKIIVSTLPQKRSILERLCSKIKHPMIEVTAPPAEDSETIIKVLLEAESRSVTLPQWRVIQEAFKHCTLPLFITLTFEEANRWRSFDEVSQKSLEHTVEASINKLFDRLEAKHGKVFVSRAFGYITAARNGLSETELEDILSLDDTVLDALFTHWVPPIRRMLPSLWPRLYLDIEAFLVEREADDIVVLGWYHSQFLNSATDRYLNDFVDYNQIHRHIADYYLGCWSGTIKKPFIYTEKLMTRYKLNYEHGMACRYVPEQPLIFRATEISERFNYRKMSQLPYSLIHSRQFDKLKAECLCNYEWLHTKLRATSIQQVIADFSMLEDNDTDLVADVLRMSGSALKIDPDALGPEISGRLLPHIHRRHWLRELVKQCDLVSQRRCPLVPNCQIYTAPGGPLQYECELDENITSAIDVDVFNTADGILMTAKPFYSTSLKVWELTQGEPRQDMHLPVGEVYPTKDGKFLAILKGSRQVLVFKTDCGELHGKIDCEYGEVVSVSVGNRYLALNIDNGVGPYVMDLHQAQLIHKFTNHSHAVAISPDESYVAFNSGTLILIHSIPLMERKCVGQASDVPLQLQFSSNANKCYILTNSKLLQVMKFDPTNRKCATSDIISDLDSKEFTLSHAENFVLVRALRCLYLICTRKEQLLHRLQRAHPGVFVETMTTFTGAGFSPRDDMVVASRYTYIFVWSTKNGDPIRVLQASLSPILKIYTSDTVNKAVALLKDNTLQVWNLDNIDANILHANEIVRGQIESVAVSCPAEKILCHDQKHSEVKIVDLFTGKATGALIQDENVARVSKVMFCLQGKYGITRNVRAETEEEERPLRRWDSFEDGHAPAPEIKWEALKDDVIWSLVTKKPIYKLPNNRFLVVDRQDTTVGFVKCTFHSVVDWTSNLYTFYAWRPKKGEKDNEEGSEERKIDFPERCEFISPPAIFTDRHTGGQMVAAVLQVCNETMVRSVVGTRTYDNYVFMNHLDKEKRMISKTIRMKDLLRYPDAKDKLAYVEVVNGNILLLNYVKNVDFFQFDNEKGLTIPPDVEKGGILYDPINGTVVRHLPSVLHAASDLSWCLMSKTSSIRVDNHLRVYETLMGKPVNQVNADLDISCTQLALDGKYIVGLDKPRRSVLVYRASDGHKMANLFIHGRANCLVVGEDDRTIVVGCCDGRVLILSLILGLSDPYAEFIQNLPYRTSKTYEKMLARSGPASLLEQDVAMVENSKPELIRLSSKIKTDVKMAMRKQASFKSLANAVVMTQRQHQANSKTCCIQ